MDAANIMIVEDNTMVAEDCRECLENLGYRVTSVSASGEDAVANAEKDRPDAVLMDIRLRGDMDGVEAASRIHDRFDIPILFLSAYSDRDLLKRARKTGSFGYLVKPYEERELYAMLEMTLYKARAEKERRRLEARLLQAQKMEATARMAAGVAHHFNNMLYVAIGNLELAKEDRTLKTAVRENLIEAEAAARRAADLSRLMLTWLGQAESRQTPLDLSKACADILARCREAAPDHATVDARLPAAGPVVAADFSQIEQIVKALVSNAWEAMSEASGQKATVAVETAAAAEIAEDRRFPADWNATEPAYACLSVADAGKGMDGETLNSIFDPFFTDKFTGRGLGLPLVLGLVRAHGGCITADSAPGRGSVFRVYFPLCAASAPAPEPDETPTEKAGIAGGAALLVEDQEQVRKLATAMLRRLGFDVIAAENGTEAVKIFNKAPEKFRLAISDLSMPVMSGWETMAALREIRPDIPVILVSGYDKDRAMAAPGADPPQAFLQKPFEIKALQETIARVLGDITKK